MTLAWLLDSLWVVSRRDLLTALRYRMGFGLLAFGLLADLAAFYYLAQAIGPQFRPDGVAYYPFLVVGTALFGLLIAGVNGCVSTVRDAQMTGTVEVLMTTATPGPVIIFLSAFSTFAGRTLFLLFYIGAGLLLFGVALPNPNWAACLVTYLLFLVFAVAMGVFAAAIQLHLQRGGGLVTLLASISGFLSGTMFPVSVLPSPLRDLAHLSPLTYALDATRAALLQGSPLNELVAPISALALFDLLLLPASLLLFGRALRYARQKGTLSFY